MSPHSILPSPTQPVSSRLVCIIGNSLIGALKKAYQSGLIDTSPFEFVFYASPGKQFNDLHIIDGAVVGVRFADRSDARLADFGAVVVYGDLPLPSAALAVFDRVPFDRYSVAVRRACVVDWLEQHHAYRLIKALVSDGINNILVLSKNYRSSHPVVAPQKLTDGVALMRELIRPAKYIPVPANFFSETGLPREELYSGSLNIHGEEPNRAKLPNHHYDHLNIDGGKIILAAILDCLRRE